MSGATVPLFDRLLTPAFSVELARGKSRDDRRSSYRDRDDRRDRYDRYDRFDDRPRGPTPTSKCFNCGKEGIASVLRASVHCVNCLACGGMHVCTYLSMCVVCCFAEPGQGSHRRIPL